METNHTISIGTTSGTLLSIAPTIVSADILKTIILGIIGAVVSFLVSYLLKRLTQR